MSIIIKNITKKFDNKNILSDINLEIDTGKLIALLGPSGCGKTTLLRVIAGLDYADVGKIFFDGQDITKVNVRNRHIGFMFQDYALFNHMSVFENVAFGLKVLPKNKHLTKEEIFKKVRQLLKFVHLDYLEKYYPYQLSGGQKQRVALARSLAVSPRLLLLDEPFGALDAKVRKNLRSWLKSIHQELKITTILVTHDQEEAMEMADEIVIMNAGKIEQKGKPDYLYNNPKNSFVTEFLGEANLFDNVKIKQDKVIIGNYEVLAPQKWQGIDKDIILYVRPHDFILSKNNNFYITQVIINNILFLGSIVNILVYSKELDKNIYVTLDINSYLNNKFIVGDTLYLLPKKLIIFDKIKKI